MDSVLHDIDYFCHAKFILSNWIGKITSQRLGLLSTISQLSWFYSFSHCTISAVICPKIMDKSLPNSQNARSTFLGYMRRSRSHVWFFHNSCNQVLQVINLSMAWTFIIARKNVPKSSFNGLNYTACFLPTEATCRSLNLLIIITSNMIWPDWYFMPLWMTCVNHRHILLW